METVNKVIEKLKDNEFFKGISENKIEEILLELNYVSKRYSKDQIIANEGEICNSLGLVIDGVVEIQRIYSNGKHIVLKHMEAGEVFGEALIFSNTNEYPSTIISSTDSAVAYIKGDDIIGLCLKDEIILKNFITLLSDKIFVLNRKIKIVSFKTIREKVLNFIFEQVRKQKSSIIKLEMSKEQIAALLGIPRPSLSRELMKLRDDGFIEFNRNTIKVLDIEALEEELLE